MNEQTSQHITEHPIVPLSPMTHEESLFKHRLTLATLGLLFVFLLLQLLSTYAATLQPLFIALFIAYAIFPPHQWLVRKGVPSLLAYVMILTLVFGFLVGVGVLIYATIQDLLSGGLIVYEVKADQLLQRVLAASPVDIPRSDTMSVRQLLTTEEGVVKALEGMLRSLVGGSFGVLTGGFVVFIYLMFLIAERATLPDRLRLAFGADRANQVQSIVGTINEAIAKYIAVKTAISLITGLLSLLVLWPFGVQYYALWALLIFLFNYIPYVGSFVAVLIPVALSFLQFETLWQPIVLSLLLLGIQQFAGNMLEPRMTGQRLDVSPVLVILSLAFWGAVWGVVGMILAVPLTVIAKIILQNIKETKPIAILVSNYVGGGNDLTKSE